MRLTLCFALLLSSPALADCVTKDDLAVGVTFKRQDGRAGEIVSTGGKGYDIKYATEKTSEWQDDRDALMGIYESSWSWYPSDEMIVGSGPGGYYTFKIAGKPPVPEPGTSWKTTVKITDSQDNGSENGAQVTKHSVKAVYSFQPTKEAKLSGCTYTILPVEATFIGEDTHKTRRYIYFPDLGFGLETRFTDHSSGEDRKLGLTAMTPM